MESNKPFAVKLISYLGWVLTILGGIFAVWVFFLILGADKDKHPLMILFFFIFIFCSIAIGQFFVVLNIIVTKLGNIETSLAEIKVSGIAVRAVYSYAKIGSKIVTGEERGLSVVAALRDVGLYFRNEEPRFAIHRRGPVGEHASSIMGF